MNRLNGPALLNANAISSPSGRQAGLTLWPSLMNGRRSPCVMSPTQTDGPASPFIVNASCR